MPKYRVWEAYELQKTVVRKAIVEANSPQEAEKKMEQDRQEKLLEETVSDETATHSGFYTRLESSPEGEDDKWKAIHNLDHTLR